MMVPPGFWMVMAFLFGITIGSFLNVVIYRLPRGESLSHPPSHCPNCNNQLTAIDLVPLLSFLFLGRKCRRCKTPISWRYFTIELLTGLLFVGTYLRFAENPANAVALMLFTAVLIPIFFIDLNTFTIPDSLNLMAFFVAIGRDIWGIIEKEPGHELLWGWLPRSVLGAIVGVLIFGAVRVLGWVAYKKEAMGLGDPLLARAMGAMLISVTPPDANPLRLFPIWVVLSCFSGLIIGIGLIAVRRTQTAAQQKAEEPSPDETETDEGVSEEGSSFLQQLSEIGYCLFLLDGFAYLRDSLNVWLNKKPAESPPQPEIVEDDWQPAPTAIPFGPFLVIGFLLAAFTGEWLTAAYLAYALPKSKSF